MAKLLLNADGKVLMKDDKVYKAPDVEDLIGQVINGTLTNYSNNNITSIRDYCFYEWRFLQELNMPNVETIGQNAFYNCTNIQTLDFPKLKTISRFAFNYCSALKIINCPNVETLNESSFARCTAIESIDMPLVKQIPNNCFNYPFKLNYVNLPLVETIGDYAFDSNRTMEKVCFPKLKEISYGSFKTWGVLKRFIIEQSETVCTLKSTNAFDNCYHILGKVNSTYNPNGDKDGYIYVPASRLAEYKVATNWVTYESQIIGHQDFNVGDTLPNYTNETFTTQTWYSDEELTTPVTSVATTGKYYLKLEA